MADSKQTRRRASKKKRRGKLGAGRGGSKRTTAKTKTKANRRKVVPRLVWIGLALACLAGALAWTFTGCGSWNPSEPFHRQAPEVAEAIAKLDAGAFESAEEVLEQYLETGACADGGIGLPPKVRKRPDGSFDLGLTLFHLAEKYGPTPGKVDEPLPPDEIPTDTHCYLFHTARRELAEAKGSA